MPQSHEAKRGKHMASPSTTKKAHSSSTSRHKRVVLCCAVLGVLAALYGTGYVYFSDHFVPRTSINGQNVSNFTQAQVAQQIEEAVKNYSASVEGQGLSLTLAANEIGLQVDSKLHAQRAHEMTQAVRWPLDLIWPQTLFVEDSVFLDDAALHALVGTAVENFNKNATPPANAVARYNDAQQSFSISPASTGTQLNADSVLNQIKQGVLHMDSHIELGSDCLEQPTIKSENVQLEEATDRANQMLATSVTLMRDGTEVATISGRDVHDYINVAEDFSINLDQEGLESWAEENLVQKVNSSDETNEYNMDLNTFAEALAQRLSEGSTKPIEADMSTTQVRPKESEGAHERGRHVDINLSTQYARLYDSNSQVLWRSYFVSGNTSLDRGTPTGSFTLNAKRKDQVLIGADEDEDGEPDYKSPVKYWMPFKGNIVGLHDAPWRSSFGGSIYSWNGSHGCINLPPEKAAELFQLIQVGDLVYVHW